MANEENTNTNTQWTDAEYSGEYPEEAQNEYAADDAGAREEYSEGYEEAPEGYEDEDYAEDNTASAPDGRKPLAVILFLIILILLCTGLFLLFKQLKARSAANEAAGQGAGVETSAGAPESSDAFFENNSSSSEGMDAMSFNDNNTGSEAGSTVQNTGADKNDTPDIMFDDNLSAADLNSTLPKEDKEAAIEREQDEILESFGEGSAAGRSNDSIMVAWNRAARQNPFRPPVFERSGGDNYEQVGDVQFEIIEPPTRLVPDENLTKLLQTQISGILYDEESPSAIVNIAGVDQFVKAGDEISGYKIRKITNSKVEISYKNNTYVASVGELFTRGRLEARPAVYNLTSKFAGRYKNENIEE